MDADDSELTMESACIACDGSGRAEHVDRTLPPPPCRLCHPDEATLHMALARETRTVAGMRRRDAYHMVRAAIGLGQVPTASAVGSRPWLQSVAFSGALAVSTQ